MTTERLYRQLDDAANELADITARGIALRSQVADLIRAFAENHNCSPDSALDHMDDALSDLMSDAEGPAYRRKVRLENEIGDLEETDLRRSAPVTI